MVMLRTRVHRTALCSVCHRPECVHPFQVHLACAGKCVGIMFACMSWVGCRYANWLIVLSCAGRLWCLVTRYLPHYICLRDWLQLAWLA